MKTKDVVKFLQDMDAKNIWIFDAAMFGFFLDEDGKKLKQSLRRYVECGLLRHCFGNIYCNTFRLFRSSDALAMMVPFMRSGYFCYVSFESALSSYGIISQIPCILTCATTGEGGIVETSIGRIEFTTVPFEDRYTSVYFDRFAGMYYAEPALAYRDLQFANRNLGLVDTEELSVVITEFEQEKKEGKYVY